MKNLKDFIPKKILVLQQRQLGDVIVTTPIFAALRSKYPHAHISLFTEDKCIALVAHDPHINSFQILNKSHKQSFFQKIISPWKTYWQIRKEKFDILIDLQQLPRCQLATFFSGARYKISFKPRHMYKKFLYTHCTVPENFEDYISCGKINILVPLGIQASHDIKVSTDKPMLYLTDREKEKARETLKHIGITEETPFITLDATHKHELRRWKHYDALIKKILLMYPQYKFLLLRAPGEEEQLQDLIEIDPSRVCMPKIAPSLRESMACMHFAHFHIGNTSAPAHMALALGIPALIILSHTSKLWHFNPKNPPKGMPKQIEVRVEAQKLAQYNQELHTYKKLEKNSTSSEARQEKSKKEAHNFLPLRYPELDLIDPDQAFLAFEKLLNAPFYE